MRDPLEGMSPDLRAQWADIERDHARPEPQDPPLDFGVLSLILLVLWLVSRTPML